METKYKPPTSATWPELMKTMAPNEEKGDWRHNPRRKRKAQSPLPEPEIDGFISWLNSMHLDKKTKQGLCLIRAAESDDLAQIKSLLNEGVSALVIFGKADENSIPSTDYIPYLGSSPIHLATSDKGRELLADGNYSSALQLIDRHGLTPFERCICNSDLDGVRFWLEKGAIINSEENPVGVLKLALNNDVIFNYLLFRGVRIRRLEDLEVLEKTAIEQNARSRIMGTITELLQDLRFQLGYDLLPPKLQTTRQVESKTAETFTQASQNQGTGASALFAKPANSPRLTSFFGIQSIPTKKIDDVLDCRGTPGPISLTPSS